MLSYKRSSHIVNFYRKQDEPGYRAVCTCGWAVEGEQDHLEAQSIEHQLVVSKPPKPRPSPRRLPFASGLSQLKPGEAP